MPVSAARAYAFRAGTISSTAVVMGDVSGAAQGFSAAELDVADVARIRCATNPIVFRYDGGVPTASVGHYLAANDETFVYGAENIRALQFIRAGGSDGSVSITLERY